MESDLKTTILGNIKANVPTWNLPEIGIDQISLLRLSGLSNACYRVKLHPEKSDGNVS